MQGRRHLQFNEDSSSSEDSFGDDVDNEPILLRRNTAAPKSPVSIRSVSPGSALFAAQARNTSPVEAVHHSEAAFAADSNSLDFAADNNSLDFAAEPPPVIQITLSPNQSSHSSPPSSLSPPAPSVAPPSSSSQAARDSYFQQPVFADDGDTDDDIEIGDAGQRHGGRPMDVSMTDIEVENGELTDRTLGVGTLPGSQAFGGEFRSMSGRTREEWKRDSRRRRRQKRKLRRKIAQRNMYIWSAVGFVLLGLFVTAIVLLYKSTSSQIDATTTTTTTTTVVLSTDPLALAADID